MSVALILGFIMPMPALANGTCSITIDANVHTNGKLAYGSGKCKQGVDGLGGVYGFYSDGHFWVSSDRLEQVKNGQVLKNRSVMGVGYMDIHVTTIPLKQSEPKPQPKPEPKPQPTPTPKPEPKPEPKPTPTPNPKPSQPSTPPKTNTPKTSTPKSKQSTTQKPSSSNTTSSTEKKQPSTNAQKKTQSNTQQKAPTPQEVKSWTVNDLKEKGAKVEEKEGKLFAIVDGVSKEITEEQAKALGYEIEEMDEQEEEQTSEEIKTDKEDENKETPKKKRSFITYLLSGLGIGVPTLGALGYAYFRRKG